MIAKCLIKSCNNLSAPALKRGLCMSCYGQAKRRVESGVTTWQKLAEIGLALPIDTEESDPFAQEFDKLTKGEVDADNK